MFTWLLSFPAKTTVFAWTSDRLSVIEVSLLFRFGRRGSLLEIRYCCIHAAFEQRFLQADPLCLSSAFAAVLSPKAYSSKRSCCLTADKYSPYCFQVYESLIKTLSLCEISNRQAHTISTLRRLMLLLMLSHVTTVAPAPDPCSICLITILVF